MAEQDFAGEIGRLAASFRDLERSVCRAAAEVLRPRQIEASPPSRESATWQWFAPQSRTPVAPTPPPAQPISWLALQADAAHQSRLDWELRDRALRTSGASETERASTRGGLLDALLRESHLRAGLANEAWQRGDAPDAWQAWRTSQGLSLRAGSLRQSIDQAPLRDEATRSRDLDQTLGARLDLLRALRAPEEQILELTRERSSALEREADALRALGQGARADRLLAQAARLATPDSHGASGDLNERIRQVLGAEPRNADRVAPLAAMQAERAGRAIPMDVREDQVGTDRRLVVELRAPRDLGHAAMDALVNEVVSRIVDTLRSGR